MSQCVVRRARWRRRALYIPTVPVNVRVHPAESACTNYRRRTKSARSRTLALVAIETREPARPSSYFVVPLVEREGSRHFTQTTLRKVYDPTSIRQFIEDRFRGS
jgi:hypothetical protein